MIRDGDEPDFRAEVGTLVDCCRANNLDLNIPETDKMITDSWRGEDQ